MPTRLLLAAILILAIALLASAASAASRDRSPMFRFCDGHMTEIPDVQPCPDGSLRIVR